MKTSYQPCEEKHVNRQVIDNQLLTALDDKSKVAILLNKEDLDLIISAFMLAENNRMAMKGRMTEFRKDLEQLRESAKL